MKKIIISLSLCFLLLLPVQASALTLQEQKEAIIIQLIQLLEETIARLQAQIQEILNQMALESPTESVSAGQPPIQEVQSMPKKVVEEPVNPVAPYVYDENHPMPVIGYWQDTVLKGKKYLSGTVDLTPDPQTIRTARKIDGFAYALNGNFIDNPFDTTEYENGNYGLSLYFVFNEVKYGSVSISIEIKN